MLKLKQEFIKLTILNANCESIFSSSDDNCVAIIPISNNISERKKNNYNCGPNKVLFSNQFWHSVFNQKLKSGQRCNVQVAGRMVVGRKLKKKGLLEQFDALGHSKPLRQKLLKKRTIGSSSGRPNIEIRIQYS